MVPFLALQGDVKRPKRRFKNSPRRNASKVITSWNSHIEQEIVMQTILEQIRHLTQDVSDVLQKAAIKL